MRTLRRGSGAWHPRCLEVDVPVASVWPTIGADLRKGVLGIAKRGVSADQQARSLLEHVLPDDGPAHDRRVAPARVRDGGEPVEARLVVAHLQHDVLAWVSAEGLEERLVGAPALAANDADLVPAGGPHADDL